MREKHIHIQKPPIVWKNPYDEQVHPFFHFFGKCEGVTFPKLFKYHVHILTVSHHLQGLRGGVCWCSFMVTPHLIRFNFIFDWLQRVGGVLVKVCQLSFDGVYFRGLFFLYIIIVYCVVVLLCDGSGFGFVRGFLLWWFRGWSFKGFFIVRVWGFRVSSFKRVIYFLLV